MCQHVAKRRIKEINIEYPQNTVEGRIAAAYAMIENSPISRISKSVIFLRKN